MSFGILLVSAFTFYYLVDRYGGRRRQHRLFSRYCQPPAVAPTDIVVRGRDLKLSREELHHILIKRFPYFQPLNEKARRIFLFRLQQFMQRKIFIIKASEGYREMPVLVSASAVQLTFGLPDFLLLFYRYIRIYPEEFISDDFTKILAGNVSHFTITVAWNHFLEGYRHEGDGANLGLHEMSHALYFQKVEVEQEYAKGFTRQFQTLYETCHHAFKTEVAGTKNLYSPYAEKNLQEFWAESIELFFEKPVALQEHYPEVFAQMVRLLNQNPVLKESPVISYKKAAPYPYYTFPSTIQARQIFWNKR